jgi:hemolysin activation/secretion protein
MPTESLQGRMRLAAGHVRSESIRSQRFIGNTSDLGWGYDRILGFQRDTVYKLAADLTWRETDSKLTATGAQISRVHDQQLRLKWSADSDRLSSEPMRVEATGVVGHYSTVEGLADVKPGNYFKLEASARKQMNLSDDGVVFGLARVRGQYSSRQLDGYNRMSLGGANSVRAYTSADGVGNDAMVGSLELNVRTRPNEFAGVFYDAGWVRPPKTEQAATPGYTLQAVGYQVVGNVGRFYYNWTVAKGVGGNKGALATDIESSPNNLRLSVSGTYVF